MSVEANRHTVQRFYQELWNHGNDAVVREAFSPDCARHDLGSRTSRRQREGEARFALRFRTGFPDMRMTVDVLIAERDLVAARWTIIGTHTGEWYGIKATGRAIRYSGVDLFRFRDDRVIELWNHPDDLGLMGQLGLLWRD